jgi:hypothetical protein
VRPSENLMQKDEDDTCNTDDESDSDDSEKDDTNDSTVDPTKRYIPRRIRLVEATDEVYLDVRFNYVAFEIPGSTDLQSSAVSSKMGMPFLRSSWRN